MLWFDIKYWFFFLVRFIFLLAIAGAVGVGLYLLAEAVGFIQS